jgi:DNA-binding MarR family transcriptional regulator
MPEQGDIARLEEAFTQTFKKVSEQWVKTVDRHISRHQMTVLSRLDASGPLNVSALAEALNITAGASTGIADKLIESGCIERTRDESDRRVVRLSITPLGRETLQILRKQKEQMLKAIFAGLNEEDVRHLTRILGKINRNIDTP